MTTHVIVAIRDTALNRFAAPASQPNTPYAVRTFAQEVNNAQNGMLYKRPQDFEMWQLAEYDEETGLFSANQPACIARAIDLKEPE